MIRHLHSRRTFIAIISIACLTGLGLYRNMDVAMAIATVAVGLAGSNAAQKAVQSRNVTKE